MYLGEISPRKLRGIVTLTFVTFMSLGKLSGQLFGLRYALMCEETTVVLIILEKKRALHTLLQFCFRERRFGLFLKF